MSRAPSITHESFGSIYAAHSSGNGPRLFMSAAGTHSSVVVRIGRASVARDLSHDFFHGDNDVIVEVEMTESQWAHFIGRPNHGTGAPCTIRYYREGDLKKAAPVPEEEGKRETFSKELSERAKQVLAGVRAALGGMDRLLKGGPVSKAALAEVRKDLSMAMANDIDAGLGFTMKQAELWLDKMADEAKTEAESYLAGGMRRLALDAVANMMTPEERENARRQLLGGPTLPTDGGHS